MSTYNILSPDGIPIHQTDTYKSPRIAWSFAKQWAKQYKNQGHYSSTKFGKVPIEDILDYCELVELT
jgi:hypothetical protein